MSADDRGRMEGILDTSTVVLLTRISDAESLPPQPLITAVTLAELAVGPLVAVAEDERASRQAHLQQAEADFVPLPFDASAARAFGGVAASLRRGGRKTAARAYDAMIAATAIANDLPIYTCNPSDFSGIDGLDVVAVPVPEGSINCAPMASVEVQGVEGMQALVGQEVGPSEWRAVTQADINAFAELSGDHQWIHVDAERAKSESPYGTTIAHGNLTLAMVDGFRDELISSTGFALGVNYGWDKIRFPAPVPVDSKVRARAEVVSVDEKGGGWWQVVTRFTLEVEGNEKPCFVGDSVTRVMAPAAD